MGGFHVLAYRWLTDSHEPAQGRSDLPDKRSSSSAKAALAEAPRCFSIWLTSQLGLNWMSLFQRFLEYFADPFYYFIILFRAIRVYF